MSWAQGEFGTVDLGSERLNDRAVLLAERLAAEPGESIPNACRGWAETQAAYRFLSNDKTDWLHTGQPASSACASTGSYSTFRTPPRWTSMAERPGALVH